MHRFRATPLLALLVVLLGTYLLVWERDDRMDRADLSRTRRLLRIEPDRVDALSVEGPSGRFLCRRLGDGWILDEPFSARADASRIQQLLAALRELPRGELVFPDRRDRDAYARYGLEPPQATLGLVQGSSTNRLLVGRRSPLGDGLYVRMDGLAAVVRIPTALLDLLPASPDAMRSRTLLRGEPSAVGRLELRNDSGYIHLARPPGGAWRILQPVATRADPVPIDSLVRELLACSIVQFVQDGVSDFTPYGLDSPNALSAILDAQGGLGSQTLFLGDPLASAPDLVYARLQGENSVYAVPDTAARALAVKLDDLRDRRIPGLALPARIQAIRVEGDGAVLELRREPDGTWQIERPRRVPADSDAVNALLSAWAGVRISAFEPPPAPPAASALPPPPAPAYTRSILITLQDSPDPILLRVGPANSPEGACRIRIDGESSSAIAEPAALLDFPIDAVPYQSLDILSIPPSDVVAVDFKSPGRSFSVRRDSATGDWVRPPDGFDDVLSALSPLRAAAWIPEPGAPPADPPFATLRITQSGGTALSNTLLFHSDGTVFLRGRPTPFRLPDDSPLLRWLAAPADPAGTEPAP